jgi:hypothetical protein
MMTDEIETDLWEALARCAADVPDHVGQRLRQRDYHPRGPRRKLISGLAAAAVVIVGTGTALITGRASNGVHQPQQYASSSTSATVPLTGGTIRLADATISLPAGFQPVDIACSPIPSGLGPSIQFFDSPPFAAAASSDGGCFEALLASHASIPSDTDSVNVGQYQGSVITDESTGVTTLYVTVPADHFFANPETVNGEPISTIDVVLTAKGLSADEVESIAEAGIPTAAIPSGPPCTGNCG